MNAATPATRSRVPGRIQFLLLAVLFAVIALFLAATGLYGVLAGALATSRLLQSLVFGVSARDPLTGLYNRRHFQEFMRGLKPHEKLPPEIEKRADPRNDIGNFTTWGEMLAVHELAHVSGVDAFGTESERIIVVPHGYDPPARTALPIEDALRDRYRLGRRAEAVVDEQQIVGGDVGAHEGRHPPGPERLAEDAGGLGQGQRGIGQQVALLRRQLDDRGGSQPPVEVVVEEDLRCLLDQLERGGGRHALTLPGAPSYDRSMPTSSEMLRMGTRESTRDLGLRNHRVLPVQLDISIPENLAELRTLRERLDHHVKGITLGAIEHGALPDPADESPVTDT